MRYLVYIQKKIALERANEQYLDVLQEKQELFSRTQPKGMQISEKVKSSNGINAVEKYPEDLEEKAIEKRIRGFHVIISEREQELEKAKRELIKSDYLIDNIYCMRFFEHRKITYMCAITGYSKAQMYKILKKINGKETNMRQNEAF